MRRAAIVPAMGLLFSCAPAPPVNIASAEAVASCQARGGTVQPLVYRAPGPICLTPYPDGDRACSDSAQCAGRCIADITGSIPMVGPGSLVRGHCESYHPTPFDECVPEVRSGRLGDACAARRPPA